MIFRIHFNVKGIDDSFLVEGDDIEDVRTKVKEESSKRNLDTHANQMWSEEIKIR